MRLIDKDKAFDELQEIYDDFDWKLPKETMACMKYRIAVQEEVEAIPVEWLLNHQRVDGKDNILELIEIWRKEK